MDNFINKLIDVDKQARNRVGRAKKERATVMESLDSKKKKRLEETERQFAAFVAAEQEKCTAQKAEAKAQLAAKKAQQIERLDVIYQENRDAWISMVVAGVLGE